MKKFVIGTTVAALLATTAWSALAQTTPETPPPPVQQQPTQPQSQDDGAAVPDDMAGAGPGWRGGHGGKRWMQGRGQEDGGGGMEGMHGRGMHGMGMNGMRGHGEMRGGGMRGMAMVDANNDNVIGDSEAASLADRGFMRLDRDASGDLDEGEFTTLRKRGGWWRGWTGAQSEGIADGLKAKFATLDADKNAKVSKEEYMADARARFVAADTDKDGKVSPWEFYAQN